MGWALEPLESLVIYRECLFVGSTRNLAVSQANKAEIAFDCFVSGLDCLTSGLVILHGTVFPEGPIYRTSSTWRFWGFWRFWRGTRALVLRSPPALVAACHYRGTSLIRNSPPPRTSVGP